MAVNKMRRHARAPSRKSAQQIVKNKEQKNQVAPVNKKDRKAVIIAQEIKFARLLSSNDKRARDKVLKNLRKWLTVRSSSSFGKIINVIVINMVKINLKLEDFIV